MKMRIPAILVAVAAGLALTACGSQSEPAAETDPDMMPGVSVENARLMLPAVAGNPAAVASGLIGVTGLLALLDFTFNAALANLNAELLDGRSIGQRKPINPFGPALAGIEKALRHPDLGQHSGDLDIDLGRHAQRRFRAVV